MKLEKLALILARINGGLNPDSEAFRLNNPGLLKAFGKHITEAVNGFRVFASWEAGFHALVHDLGVKCSGKSRTFLKASSPLRDLLALWDIKEPRKVSGYVSRAIGAEVTPETPLSFFMEVQ